MTIYIKELIAQLDRRYGKIPALAMAEKLFEIGVVDHTLCKVLAVRQFVTDRMKAGDKKIDAMWKAYLSSFTDVPQSFALLTDRRNLALAVNTSDFPGTEIHMWYNPDLMENRQRAVFMAGCDYLLPELISFAYIAS